MNMTPKTKQDIYTVLSTAEDDKERQELAQIFIGKGYSQADLNAIYPISQTPVTPTPSAPIQPAQNRGFVEGAMNSFAQSAVGKTLATAGSGFVEGATGLNPEQAASNVSQNLGGKPIETLQSGMSVNLPFLDGGIDPARTVGQVAGSLVSPYSKIKFAGALLNKTIGALARTFGNTAVMAVQDKLDPNGELSFNDLASLVGADVAGALVQKLIPGAGATADNVLGSKGGANISELAGATAGAAKPVASELSEVGFATQQKQLPSGPQQKLLPPRQFTMPENMPRKSWMPQADEVQAGTMPGTSRMPPTIPGAPRNTAEYITQQQAAMPSQVSQLPPTKDLPSREQEALRRIQAKPKTETRGTESGKGKKSNQTASKNLLRGQQFVDAYGRPLEVVRPAKSIREPLVVRNLSTGEVSDFPNNSVVELLRVGDTNLNNLFGQ